MEFVADLHIHSRHSRATSKELDLEHLWVWAQRKGVTVVGTGDFTHPGWFAELQDKLDHDPDSGLFALKPELAAALADQVPPPCRASSPVRFMLTVEISTIYKHGDRTRKVHHLICVPDLPAAASLNRMLERVGNIRSDGRPILGLDSRDLLEIALASSPRAVLIPAHIWTPWFSVLGSKSGFDSIEACYRDLSDQIFALETGLSSDPPMNWRVSGLDRYALVSHSDAHSPAKLAREADLFDCEAGYDAIFEALRTRRGFHGTIEFFPEEGKYHLDGHRKCGTRMTPDETRARDGLCPACGRPVTVGVMYRVEELADRPAEAGPPPGAAPYVSLVGLAETLAEVTGKGAGTKTVRQAMEHLLERLGPELPILRAVPLEDLERAGGPVLAEAIRRMRAGEVQIEGGYDGEFGRVHLVDEHERKRLSGQTALFILGPARGHFKTPGPSQVPPGHHGAGAGGDGPLFGGPLMEVSPDPGAPPGSGHGLNAAQLQAVEHRGSPVVITAGPGTGKTRCLTQRIARRILEGGIDPASVLAVTFTTKAAAELRSRLLDQLGEARGDPVVVTTFHALALRMLNEHRRAQGAGPLEVVDQQGRLELLASLLGDAGSQELARSSAELGLCFARGEETELQQRYRALLKRRQMVDLDGVVPDAVALLQEDASALLAWRRHFRMVCVDEYQDVNMAQYQLVQLLCPDAAETDLCVIGDPDQAIYSFRGADPGYFLRFSDDYPRAERITLETSYRTARNLLEAAQQVIRGNPDRPQASRTWSDQPGAARVAVCRTATAAAEAELVVHSIERMVSGTTFFSMDSGRVSDDGPGWADETCSFGDFAVLFRLRSQAELLQEAFHRSGIPYLCPAARPPVLTPVLEAVARLVDGTAPPALAALADPESPRASLERLALHCCPEEDRQAALEQIRQLAVILWPGGGATGEARRWGRQVLALHAAGTEADQLPPRAEAVSLLTLHASKGLEFTVVFIVGCEEGLLPHLPGGCESEPERIAEERRLFYVGMTRARRRLVLTHAARRRALGPASSRQPSRYLAEIPPALFESIRPEPLPGRRRPPQLELF